MVQMKSAALQDVVDTMEPPFLGMRVKTQNGLRTSHGLSVHRQCENIVAGLKRAGKSNGTGE